MRSLISVKTLLSVVTFGFYTDKEYLANIASIKKRTADYTYQNQSTQFKFSEK